MSQAVLGDKTKDRPSYIHEIQGFAGQKAGRVDLSQKALAASGFINSTGASVPENFKVVSLENVQTTPFKAQYADEIKKLVKNNVLDRIVERDEVVNYTTYPFSCIGKLFVGANNNFTAPLWTGSAALVGRNVLLTASHCAPWNETGTDALPGWWMRFVPAYNNGSEVFGDSYVREFYGIPNKDNVTGLDYVVCRLYTSLGDTLGYLGSQSWPSNASYMPPNSWTSVGYPGDAKNGQVMMIERRINLHQVDPEGGSGRELESHTFSTPGWSGGPMFGTLDKETRCVGVLSGREFENDGLTGVFAGAHWHSVSAAGAAMNELIKYGRENWD
jgi:V8-like Glu-specific endopeptidase